MIQIGFAGLAFANAVILARLLGAEGYGAFANAMAWTSLLVIITTFGFGALLVRDVAIYRSRGKWATLKGLLSFSHSFVLALSVLSTLVFLVIAGLVFSGPEHEVMRFTLWIAAPLVPLLALLKLRESAARGLEFVIRARLPALIFRPGLLLIGIVSTHLWWPGQLSAPAAMVINVGSATVALAIAMLWLRRLFPAEVRQAKPEYQASLWLKAAFPMLIYSGMQLFLGQIDIVMLGVMRDAEEVGLYAAASRLAYLLVYVTAAADIIVAPIMARLYSDGEKAQLQKILNHAVRIAFLVVLPFGLALIFAGEIVLGVFGHEFVAAHSVLAILAVGRLLDVAFGSGALVLAMTGHQRIVAVIFASAVVMNVVMNIFLIPRYGIEGAAIASIVCLVMAKSILGNYARSIAGLRVTFFSVFTK